jgi:hypothetical protein
MGLFGKNTIACPACDADVDKREKMDHWLGHTYVIVDGEGSGSYTWKCKCGPADMYWAKDHQAAAGMAVHMARRHQIPV